MVGIKTVDIQADKPIDEEKIEALAFQVLNAEKDEQRIFYNEELKSLLSIELSKPSAFKHPFSKIKSMTVLCPPDSSFRLFNWNIPSNDGTFQYECGILPKQSDFFFLSTIDEDSLLDMQLVTSKNQWIAGLIYEIIPKKTDLQLYYTLLVWDGNNRLTKKKRIDVLWFDQLGDVRFGAPIFNVNGVKQNRILFEFSAQNSMELKFDFKNNRILLDHLSPSSSSLEGIYEYYGADLSYDSYLWKKDMWLYQDDVDAEKNIKKRKKDFKIEEDIIKEQDEMYSPKN